MAEGEGGQRTVTVEDYDKQVERARNFESQLTDKERKLKAYEGIDIEKLKADSEALKNLQKEHASKGDPKDLSAWEEAKEKEINERYSKKLGEYETSNKELLSKLNRLEVVVPTLKKAAELFVESEIDTVELLVDRDLMLVDGKICVRGKDGKPIASIKNPREDMGAEEYLTILAEKHPVWCKPTMQAGSKQGGTTTATSSSGLTAEKYAKMSREEQLKLPASERGKFAAATLKQGLI